MRILLLNDGLPPETLGGAGRIVCNLAEALQAQGHTVLLVTAADEKEPSTIQGVPVIRIPKKNKRWAHYRCVFSTERAKELAAIMDAFMPDVVHGHVLAWQLGYTWIPEARKRGIPSIVTAHDVSHIACGKITGQEKALWLRDAFRYRWEWNPFRNTMIRKALAQCTVLAVSDALKQLMEKHGIRNIQTVHNGIDPHSWHVQNQAHARTELGMPEDQFIAMIAGRLGADKGTKLLMRTFPRDGHLIVAGEGEVDFLPGRSTVFPKLPPSELQKLYSASDVVLTPSLCFDCFPTVNLEAMACGRAVLATTRGGSAENVTDGETGYILDPADELLWKQKLEWCVSHRKELHEMGLRGRERLEKEFSQNTFVDVLVHVYENVIRKTS